MKAICPGSFDPVTHGHLDIFERCAAMFDELVVAVGSNMSKTGLFQPADRVEMIQEATEHLPNVQVQLFSGLLTDYCRENGVGVIVKGLRFAADFDYELQMAQMNRRLEPVETIMLPTSDRWSFVSSTLVREIAKLGGDVAQFVPESVSRRLR